MKFLVAKKILMTEWYAVEAETEKDALDACHKNLDTCRHIGFEDGWKFGDTVEVIVIPIKEDFPKKVSKNLEKSYGNYMSVDRVEALKANLPIIRNMTLPKIKKEN